MPKTVKPFTVDPKAAKAGRDRVLDEDAAIRNQDPAGSHDPLQPGDDRRESGKRNIDIDITRRAD